jgi:hypothetical protein
LELRSGSHSGILAYVRLETAAVLNDLTLAGDQFCQFWFEIAGIDFMIGFYRLYGL